MMFIKTPHNSIWQTTDIGEMQQNKQNHSVFLKHLLATTPGTENNCINSRDAVSGSMGPVV